MGEITNVGSIAASNWSTAAYTISLSDWGTALTYSSTPKPKTNLDWLDERVNEIRVRL